MPNDRKRKREKTEETDNKMLKISKNITIPYFPSNLYNYVSPSRLYNYVRNDPFQDILNKFPDYFTNYFKDKNIVLKKDTTTELLFQQGNDFEFKVKNLLAEKYNITSLPSPYEGYDNKTIYHMTLDALSNGVDIIYQGCLFNSEMKVYGHPDFLVRSDLVNQLCINNNYPNENASSYFGDYHYVVFDTKFHTLHMRSDMMKGMRNGTTQLYYKIQLYIYSKCLEYVQGICPNYAYVIGRGYKSEKTVSKQKMTFRSNNIFDLMGNIDIINIQHETETRDLTVPEWIDNGIEWINTLNKIKKEDLDDVDWANPEQVYFRPNMNNKSSNTNKRLEDTTPIRRELAILQGEPTLLSNVSTAHRNTLHMKNIYSMWDDSCNSKMMGFKDRILKTDNGSRFIIPNLTAENIDIRIQQFKDETNTIPDIYGRHISNTVMKNQTMGNRDLLKYLKEVGYIVMDFENRINICDKFDKLPESENNSTSYLVGLMDENKNFKSIIADRLNAESEYKLFRELIDYMTPRMNNASPTKILIWSKAERAFINKLCKTHAESLSDEDFDVIDAMLDNMVDMLEFFEVEKIIIKGCYTLGLKDVAKNLHRLGKIDTIWSEDSCGLGLLNGIDIIHDEVVLNDCNIHEHPQFSKILEYNKIDCQVIVEMVDWLYSRHHVYFK